MKAELVYDWVIDVKCHGWKIKASKLQGAKEIKATIHPSPSLGFDRLDAARLIGFLEGCFSAIEKQAVT